ncbi:hypothetical protein KFL_004520110 [Klebsormidium nitens]|uniref:Uncharacterized protein n=1 Tax=Klebsormidium nitens TaxID=105231 RepID=A0A1Y1ICK3_KLENI|nr:hypothetical protein KFL_004520110 [Klebsormidium nitens]|eukprot:GAQ88694.1 hypothetical protein KFL_004520110 [Klebsormidium nitens]
MEDKWAPRKGVTSPIRQLVLSAEKERSELGEYRVRRCEAMLRAKEEEVAQANRKLAKLQENFEYHLQLLTERDAELARFEEKVAELQNTPVARDRRQSESNVVFTARPGTTPSPPAKATALEKTVHDLTQRLQDAEEDQTSVARIVEAALLHESRRFEKQMQRQLDAKDQETEARRVELTNAYEGLLKQQRDEMEARVNRQQADVQDRWLKVERDLKAAVAQADAQAKRAAESEYELAKMREQLADAAAAGALAAKALEEEKRNGTERLEKERKDLTDVRAELLAEYDRKSGEMLTSLRAVEEAFEQEKGAHETEKQKLQDEIADLRLQAQTLAVRLEVAAARSGDPNAAAERKGQADIQSEGRESRRNGQAAQELELLKKELAALRSEAGDRSTALRVGELEVQLSKLRTLVGGGWLAANLAEAYLTVDSQQAGKPCRSMMKRLRRQLEEVGRGAVEKDTTLAEDRKAIDRELRRLRELKELVKAGGKEDEDGSNGDVEEEGVKQTQNSGPVNTRRISSGSARGNSRSGEATLPPTGPGSHQGSEAQSGKAGKSRTVSYRAGAGGLTVHVQDDDVAPLASQAPAKRTAVEQLLGGGRGADVQDKKVDVSHDVSSGHGTPNPFAAAANAKSGAPKVETTWAEIRVISKHDVEVAGARAIEDRLAPKLASMEKVMSQIVSYEKLRAERRKRSATKAPAAAAFEVQQAEKESEAVVKMEPIRNVHVASEEHAQVAKASKFELERQDTEIYYEEAAGKGRSARPSRAESATRAEQNMPTLPAWLAPEPKNMDSPASRIESLPGGLASEVSFDQSSTRSWNSGTEANGGTEQAATDDALITSDTDAEEDDGAYGKEQTLAAAFQAYKHKYGAQNRRVSRAASTGKVTPSMTPSKGGPEVVKRRHQSVSGRAASYSMSEKGPSLLGSPERATKGPWRSSYKGASSR